MGEDEVLAAAVDVQRQVGLAHGRAFDVPAGPSLAPGAFPEGLAGFGGLPEGEIQRIFLFFAGGHARAGLEIVQAAAGKFAVGWIGPHAKVDVPGRRGIGLALFDEARADILHLRDVVRGAGLMVGALDIEAVHILMEGADIGLGHFLPVPAFLIGAADDLVVHIREVADEGHVQALRAHVADQQVKDDGRAGMPDMAVVVGGDAADVHVHLAGTQGSEGFLFTGKGIVELHGRYLADCGLS